MKGGGGLPKISRKRAPLTVLAKKIKRLDTQVGREKILSNLKRLIERAHYYATNKRLSLDERREWMRLEAYLAQTYNSIAKTYDQMDIKRQLEELKRLVDLEFGEGAQKA